MAEIHSYSSKIINGTCLQTTARLEELDTQLKPVVVSPKDLETVSAQLDLLRAQAIEGASKTTYQSLCGRVATLSINNLIDAIVDESFALLEGKFSSPEDRAQRILALKHDMANIWNNHALSAENRRFIKIASANLQRLSLSTLSDSTPSVAKTMTRDTSPLIGELSDSEKGELACTLCEIAHTFYQHKLNAGIEGLRQLSEAQQQQLAKHCLNTGAEMPLKVDASHNLLLFVQALIGYANELAQGEGIDYYPSFEELKQMFAEAASLA